jgi:putative spermidine/putrescine transport system permease protein
MFISGANITLPKKMIDNILSEIEPTVAAVSAMQIVLVSGVIFVATKRRRSGNRTDGALIGRLWKEASHAQC